MGELGSADENKASLIRFRRLYDQNIGRRKLLMENLATAKESASVKNIEHEQCIKARTVVQIVAKNTQKKVELHIGNLVSLALASVFPNPYTFSLRFIERRNTIEADLIFSKNGNETDDLVNSGGGGVCDIASFALKVAAWSFKKTRPTFILDEPDKFLHNPDYQKKASQMMKELCARLGFQIIMVSDQSYLKEAADREIHIEQNEKGESFVAYVEQR